MGGLCPPPPNRAGVGIAPGKLGISGSTLSHSTAQITHIHIPEKACLSGSQMGDPYPPGITHPAGFVRGQQLVLEFEFHGVFFCCLFLGTHLWDWGLNLRASLFVGLVSWSLFYYPGSSSARCTPEPLLEGMCFLSSSPADGLPALDPFPSTVPPASGSVHPLYYGSIWGSLSAGGTWHLLLVVLRVTPDYTHVDHPWQTRWPYGVPVCKATALPTVLSQAPFPFGPVKDAASLVCAWI